MRIMFVGDISLGEYYPSFGHGPKSYAKNNKIFDLVNPIFQKADFVVGNLEAALTNFGYDQNDPERVVLMGDPVTASEQLVESGFKILQIANNHTVQHDLDGFKETLDTLESSSIQAVGLLGEELVTVNADNKSFGFMAASDVPDNTYKDQAQYNKLNDDFISRVAQEVKKVDHLIVMLHWGLEASTSPLPYQRSLVDNLYKLGVRAIIGSHPHLFYEIEKRDNFVVAYSLGNFVFDLCWDKRLTKSGILDIEFNDNDISVRMWPVELRKNGCLPTPNSESIEIQKCLKYYNLGNKMNYQLIRKNIYFLKNILKGNTRLKARFFLNKIFNLFSKSNPI